MIINLRHLMNFDDYDVYRMSIMIIIIIIISMGTKSMCITTDYHVERRKKFRSRSSLIPILKRRIREMKSAIITM